MKKILIPCILLLLSSVSSLANATNINDFYIIPEPENQDDRVKAVKAVNDAKGGSVVDIYNTQATKLKTAEQLASGIMTRDTILDYILYLVSFLSQLGLFIGAVMIVYAGYLYATAVFSGNNATKGKTAIGYAIAGILVIIFAYAIVRILSRTFLF